MIRHASYLTAAPLVALIVAGCGSSAVTKKPLPAELGRVLYTVGAVRTAGVPVPGDFTKLVESALWTRLSNARRLGKESDPNAYRIDVTITDYRERSAATRVLFGAMAGADLVEATAHVIRLSDQERVGEWEVSAYSAAAVTDTGYVAGELAETIVQQLTRPGG